MNQLTNIANNLQILQIHTQIAPPTSLNTTVNPSKKWAKSNYPNAPANNNLPIPQLPNYHTNLPLKFHPQFNYYTYAYFMNPKKLTLENGEDKKLDTVYIVLKDLTSPKYYMDTKTYYEQK
jgi:hypothetical protein